MAGMLRRGTSFRDKAWPGARTAALVAVGGLALTGALALPGASAIAPADGASGSAPNVSIGARSTFQPSALKPYLSKISSRLSASSGQVQVFVQTSGTGALATSTAAKRQGVGSATVRSRVTSRVASIKTTNRSVAKAATHLDAKASTLYTTAYTVPGVAMSVDVEALDALAQRNDVVEITPIVRRKVSSSTTPNATATPSNGHSDDLVQAIDTWNTGHTGQGAAIAVIDTGLDYTHADFGGAGTVSAYQLARTDANSDTAPAATLYDPAKYLGGYDFAGENYDADPASTIPSATDQPVPDANPIDGPGGDHGTHVAGTAAGYGVVSAGTFTGDYGVLDSAAVDDFTVAPGAAPEAGLYSLKVFGDHGGSTDVVGAALDWIGQQVALGTSIDIANLSLGSDYAPADDPENAKIDALTAAGVLVVAAAGNAGDITDAGGSPGNAASALTVAATSTGHYTYDSVEVTEPSSLAGTYPGNYTSEYHGTAAVEADVVALPDSNAHACSTLSNLQRQTVTGKIVWLLVGDADDPGCDVSARFDRLAAAGAVGVVIPAVDADPLGSYEGTSDIPGIELTLDATSLLRAASASGALRLRLTPGEKANFGEYDSQAIDTVAWFSSRGAHGSYQNIIKPDVAAPGVSIVSAANGSGTGAAVMSGTSMATPLVAGVAALVAAAHPTWTAGQLKTQLINTATHNVVDTGTGLPYSPLRVGTGRIDAQAAVSNDVLLSSVENASLISASFGVLEVSAPVTQTRTLAVVNSGTSAHTYDVAYESRLTMPGVVYSVSPAVVTVPAGGSVSVTLTMKIADPKALTKPSDPTQPGILGSSGLSALLGAGSRVENTVAAASGIVRLTTTDPGASELRLAVYAAPKPTSTMTAGSPVFVDNSLAGDIPLTGHGFQQADPDTDQDIFESLVIPLQLGTTDPVDANVAPGSDLVAVGAVTDGPAQSNIADGVLGFGVAMAGNWDAISPDSMPTVYFDTTGDGQDDYVTYATPAGGGVDMIVAVTQRLSDGEEVDVEPVNFAYGDVDTNVYDTNVVVLPVALSALGYHRTSATFDITYQAQVESSDGVVMDAANRAAFNVAEPDVWFGGQGQASFLYSDLVPEASDDPSSDDLLGDDQGASIPVQRSALNTDAQVLLLHLHNATGAKTQIVRMPPEAAGVPTVSGTPQVGQVVTAKAGNWRRAEGATFSYQWIRDGELIPGARGRTYQLTGTDADSFVAVVITATSARGSGSATSQEILVTAANAKVSMSVNKKSVRYGAGGTYVSVTLDATTAKAGGVVAVADDDAMVAYKSVRAGTTSVRLTLPRRLSVGKHALSAGFMPNDGSGVDEGYSSVRTLTVTKAKPKITVKAAKKSIKAGSKTTLKVVVKAPGITANGRFVVKEGKRTLAKGTIKKGKGSITLKNLAVGSHFIKVTYQSTSITKSRTSKAVKIMVKR